MKDEIKEILNEMLWQFEKYPNDDFIIGNKESRILLDYITTLQEDLKDACEVIEKLKDDKKKAVEKINSMFNVFPVFRNGKTIISENLIELLNILQGDDNNE